MLGVVFGAVNAAVGLVAEGKAAVVADALVALGRRHLAYGVQPQHSAVFEKALFYSLEQALGTTKFTSTIYMDSSLWCGLEWYDGRLLFGNV